MVSMIEVIPEEVRGYGNIMGVKSVEDFTPVNSELTLEEDIYILTALSGVRVILTASSSSISYGSSVTLSATVIDEDTPVTGETVTFYDGTTSLGTGTTDSSGVATYTSSSLSVGSHSLSAVYDDKTSNTVDVTVNKLTPTISLSVPATGTVGTSYTVSGTLTPSSGSVKLYENSVLKDTLTVSSGSFSKSITQNSEGTYSYYAVFEGSSTYDSVTSSTGSIVVSDTPAPTPASVSLTSDKSILSYADSESATLSATVLDSSSNPMSGVTVEFFKGSTSLGTADTNSSGVATKSYASAGSGDVSFTAEVGSLVSETYVVEDCLVYDTASTDQSSKFSTLNLNSFSHNTDHYEAVRTLGTNPSSTYYSPIYISDLTLPTNFEISIDVLFTSFGSNNQSGFNVSNANLQTYSGSNEASVYGIGQSQGLYYRSSGTLTKYDVGTGINSDTWYRFYMKVEGTSVVGKITKLSDDTVTLNKTATMANIQSWKKFNISVGGQSQTMSIKNIKVKAL